MGGVNWGTTKESECYGNYAMEKCYGNDLGEFMRKMQKSGAALTARSHIPSASASASDHLYHLIMLIPPTPGACHYSIFRFNLPRLSQERT